MARGRRSRAWGISNTPKAKKSRKRGHKPVQLLESLHANMVDNEKRLRALIAKRKASGE